MPSTQTGRVFIAGLWAIGLLGGVAIAKAPEMIPLPTPFLTLPLLAALAADLGIRPAIRAGRIAPLTMNDRAIGVLGAGVLGIVVAALIGA